jgi:hypothetical protein
MTLAHDDAVQIFVAGIGRTLALLVCMLALPAAVLAEDRGTSESARDVSVCHQWGVTLWGATYHFQHDLDYNGRNWGLGLRCYTTPANKVFLEADALVNSFGGLFVPISVGREFRIAPITSSCDLRFVAAFTAGYYTIPDRQKREIRAGPLPGFALGCGRIRPSVTVIPTASREIITALVASTTIVF